MKRHQSSVHGSTSARMNINRTTHMDSERREYADDGSHGSELRRRSPNKNPSSRISTRFRPIDVLTAHRSRRQFLSPQPPVSSSPPASSAGLVNKRRAVAAQSARSRCKVLSIQYIYYFRAYQRQWNGK